MTVKREPNSQECIYFGRKLSNISCDMIETSGETYLCIGSNQDDVIGWDSKNPQVGPTLKERVVIHCINEDEKNNGKNGFCFDIDLEDVLRFAAEYCRVMYERVAKEVTPYDDSEIRK